MNKYEVILDRERETKRTWRYSSDEFGTIYIPKVVLGVPAPEQIKLTLEAAD